MTQAEIEMVNSWLNSDRDYEAGVQLFSKLSNNAVLKRLFPGKERMYSGKLGYELRKLATKMPTAVQSGTPVKPASLKPSSIPVLPDPGEPFVEFVSLMASPCQDAPLIVRKICAEWSTRYKERSIAHNSLKAVPGDNRPESVSLRKVLVDKMAEYSERMDFLFNLHQDWKNMNIVPDENLVYPPKDTKVNSVDQTSLEDLIKARLNLQKSISQDNNFLNFCNRSRQPLPNPMSPGPKRTALEKRIKDKKAQIVKLTAQIDGINKSSGV
ncbi:MAG: hypothetical protein WC699_16060 [Bacteroidales bacterium]|jgi:hypothetical protein